ncbi:MAG: nuclear transport factor 2 family protein [Cryobacterium sp.]|nr:nuclear transport factor 2 family protein [Cryobacterium sp.]
MFAAFSTGDIDALLQTVHPESLWTYYVANPRTTKAEFTGTATVRRFFERIPEWSEISELNTDEYVVQGDTVEILSGEACIVRTTG